MAGRRGTPTSGQRRQRSGQQQRGRPGALTDAAAVSRHSYRDYSSGKQTPMLHDALFPYLLEDHSYCSRRRGWVQLALAHLSFLAEYRCMSRSVHKRRRPDCQEPSTFRPIGRKLIGEVLRASARIEASRNALLSGFGMTGPRLRLMKMIRRRREPRTVAQLARAIGVARQTLRDTVRDLVASGLLNLERNALHRRASIVMLTPDGEALLDRLLPVEQRWIADLTRGFDESVLAQTEWVIRCVRERLME